MWLMDYYQKAALSSAIYPKTDGLEYTTLGLAGEAGEVANVVKKFIRDGTEYSLLREKVAAELGDVLWYIAALAHELDIDLDEIADMNIRKLRNRKERGRLQGDGDTR